MPSYAAQIGTLFIFLQFFNTADSWWLLAAQLSSSPHLAPYIPENFHCRLQPGLTRKQRLICSRHPAAMRAISHGLGEAIHHCQLQFARERWNCSATFDFNNGPIKVATAEAAFLYAITSGSASYSLAQSCSDGKIPECGCGIHDELVGYTNMMSRSRREKDEFVWAGCSDDVKFSNSFTRKFIDAIEKIRPNARSLMNLHNNRVGRRILASNMRRKCKCHGVSGSCVTKTCWWALPNFEEYASTLKRKYKAAKQVTVSPDKAELVMRQKQIMPSQMISPSRSGRFLKDQYRHQTRQATTIYKDDLVYLDSSPDYCTASFVDNTEGTAGRECFSEQECEDLCCGRGWDSVREIRKEPCKCRFIWCCDVKCESCLKEVTRMFCR